VDDSTNDQHLVYDDFFITAALTEYREREIEDGYKGPFIAAVAVLSVINFILLISIVFLFLKC